jgi:hypothetical protein
VNRQDPAAVAVISVALVIVVGAAAYVGFSVLTDKRQDTSSLADAVQQARKRMESAIKSPAPKEQPPAAAQVPTVRSPTAKAPAAPKSASAPIVLPLQAGRVWSYQVTLEPPQWRDAVLDYRAVEMVNGITVYTEFRHASGKMNFQLGTFAANHPSHANTRFPGFFMVPAYWSGRPLEVGQRFGWEWPWMLPGGGVKAGRVKRYAGEMKAWENLAVPAGTFPAARIEGQLQYVEDNVVRATVRETLWYSPQFGQLAKVQREGASPDEGARRIVAELIALK